MLRTSQFIVCTLLAGAFWVLATLVIRLDPGAVADGLRGDLGFVSSLPASWLCVWLVCRLAKLEPQQVLAGCLVVLGDDMLIDGVALRWFHSVYGAGDPVARTGGAWLLWGYGLSAWIAFVVAARKLRSGNAAAPGTWATQRA